jgi:hypothetical protein
LLAAVANHVNELQGGKVKAENEKSVAYIGLRRSRALTPFSDANDSDREFLVRAHGKADDCQLRETAKNR